MTIVESSLNRFPVYFHRITLGALLTLVIFFFSPTNSSFSSSFLEKENLPFSFFFSLQMRLISRNQIYEMDMKKKGWMNNFLRGFLFFSPVSFYTYFKWENWNFSGLKFLYLPNLNSDVKKCNFIIIFLRDGVVVLLDNSLNYFLLR